MKNKINSGFTLLELSIVMIIVAMIAGAIFVGSDLIREGEINSVVADMQKINSGYQQYRQKYRAVPGDHAKAFEYFGTDCGADADACNGTGDLDLSDEPNSRDFGEQFMFFRHLFLAKMYNQELSGASNSSSSGSDPILVIETNTPYISLSGITLWGITSSKSNYFVNGTANTTGARANILSLASYDHGTDAAEEAIYSAVNPDVAKRIDSKLDDGEPGTGAIIAGKQSSGCATSSTMKSAEYSLSNTNKVCTVGFIMEEPI